MLQALLDAPAIGDADLSSLRNIVAAAAPVPVPLLRRAIERIGPIFSVQYGATETAGHRDVSRTRCKPDGDERDVKRIASVGHPGPRTRHPRRRRRRPATARSASPAKCWTFTDERFDGYWNNTAATLEALRDGWYRTGDVGYLDEDGYLFLVDRKKDMIISGGENIYSREVEDAVQAYPGVHRVRGDRRARCEVGRGGARPTSSARPARARREAEVIAHCKRLIASYKCPKQVEVVGELPRVASGKVNKVALRELRARQLEQERHACLRLVVQRAASPRSRCAGRRSTRSARSGATPSCALLDELGRARRLERAAPAQQPEGVRRRRRPGADRVVDRRSRGRTPRCPRYIERLQAVFARLESLPRVTLAEIGGAALGGGLELALCCDLRIAAHEAKIGLPEVGIGLIPGLGGTQRLTRLVGRGIASRLILGAEPVDGAAAQALGIVQWAVPRAELAAEAARIARRIAALPLPALRVAKELIAAARRRPRRRLRARARARRRLLLDTPRRANASPPSCERSAKPAADPHPT